MVVLLSLMLLGCTNEEDKQMFSSLQSKCVEAPLGPHCDAMVRFTERDTWPWEDSFAESALLTLTGQYMAWKVTQAGVNGGQFALIRVGDEPRVSMSLNALEGYSGQAYTLNSTLEGEQPAIADSDIMVQSFNAAYETLEPLSEPGIMALVTLIGGPPRDWGWVGGWKTNLPCQESKQLLPQLAAYDNALFSYSVAFSTLLFVSDKVDLIENRLKNNARLLEQAELTEVDTQSVFDFHLKHAGSAYSMMDANGMYSPFNNPYAIHVGNLVASLAVKATPPSNIELTSERSLELRATVVNPMRAMFTNADVLRHATVVKAEVTDEDGLSSLDPFFAIRELTKHANEATERQCESEETAKQTSKFYEENVDAIQFATDVIDPGLGAAFRFFRLLTEE